MAECWKSQGAPSLPCKWPIFFACLGTTVGFYNKWCPVSHRPCTRHLTRAGGEARVVRQDAYGASVVQMCTRQSAYKAKGYRWLQTGGSAKSQAVSMS